jgi:hypothetical protein
MLNWTRKSEMNTNCDPSFHCTAPEDKTILRNTELKAIEISRRKR